VRKEEEYFHFSFEALVTTVLIRGEGVAASCCAQLLVDQAGLRVVVETAFRPKLPAIMLGEVTQRLLEDVFSRRDLLQGLPQIRKRVVLWGESADPLTLPHSAVVVNEQELLDRIHRQVPPVKREDRSDAPTLSADWTIHTARRLPSSAVEHHFGSRMASVAAVKLRPGHDAEVCWVESLEHGWLFLLPTESGDGWLLAAGDAVESLLERSRLVAEQIGECGEVRGQFPAHPRMADPLCEPGWLACGTGAMSFDPLCGDGTGHAAREAILGAAVVRAASEGASVDRLLAHYRTKLLAGFRRHLASCSGFYQSGHRGPWWNSELEELRRGREWCSRQLDGASGFRYRLNGFSLDPL
jgi:hypothetical protein